ncbi:single-stranded-DNA-specific exonuclease RecJ [Candidatus Gracilibacteria bacterium]|nr:single-stranded-DNA-specific exonuclease RecJ [Candidatus Gracilibacteria bacterium]
MEKLSWSGKRWADAPVAERLEEIQKILLQERSLTEHDAIQSFLHPTLQNLHSPWNIFGMEKAVQRIIKALKKKERIIIFGDFDADGITSTVILVQALKDCGAEVSYRIPTRNIESHGLKKTHIDELLHRKVSLLITCDCGINDDKAVHYAHEQGMDVIVTDHHESKKSSFPSSAVAVLNPKLPQCMYPEKNLSGAGIALKLVMALAEKYFETPEKIIPFLDKFFEICAIGLIADCVDLVGENRILAKFGLEKMSHTDWKGLAQLLHHCHIDPRNIDEQTIGFTIAPRLNAASRIGDVLVAAQLFLGESDMHASRITKLDHLNDQRKQTTQRVYRESLSQIHPGAAMQCFFRESWNPGILGLLAGRHVEELDVPTVACSLREDGLLTASCRAPLGYKMVESLQEHSNLFEQFGGHNGAAGFTAKPEKREQIHRMLEAHFARLGREKPAIPVSAYLSCDIIDLRLSEFLKYFSPFGNGNKESIFGLREVEILDFQIMGKEKNHLRIVGLCGERQLDFTAFFADKFLKKIKVGQVVDVLFTVSENIWQEQRRLQLRVVDVAMSSK